MAGPLQKQKTNYEQKLISCSAVCKDLFRSLQGLRVKVKSKRKSIITWNNENIAMWRKNETL
jgi:hypothetical protein